MLMVVEENVTVSRRTQLTFDFVAPEDVRKPLRRKRSAKVKKNTAQIPPATGVDCAERQQRVEAVCLLLHELARKFVPQTDFRNYTTFARCATVLSDVGVIKEVPLELNATAAEHESALITHAPQYRRLRARAIAGLATVADLGIKAPAKGSPDYQKGMRDAYHHASNIASMFLEDVQNGV